MSNDIIIEAKRTPITKSSDLKDVVEKLLKEVIKIYYFL